MTDWLGPRVAGWVETTSQWCEVFQPLHICVGCAMSSDILLDLVNTAESIH